MKYSMSEGDRLSLSTSTLSSFSIQHSLETISEFTSLNSYRVDESCHLFIVERGHLGVVVHVIIDEIRIEILTNQFV